ncbi:aldo/keto reductase [Brevundimonas staleyi]|uniref:Aldo/keto reductase n=1 Tax=Brevundimonas staleyi TaxID=74326 RepID=A0ABW0FX26_9CAUL
MRTIPCAPINREVSVIGFGCASLGSRVSPADGAAALALAYENGVTWYDVAPPYGDGQAEAQLGEFLRGKRQTVAICTKVGIGRPEVSGPQRLVRAVARPIIKALPQLRAHVAGLRGGSGRSPIRAAMIEPSVTRSLRDLKTDYIDVLALHEPTVEEVRDPDILAALKALVDKGHVRALAVAGAPDAIQAANTSGFFDVAQTPDSVFTLGLDAVPPRSELFAISHGVFGSNALEQFTALLKADLNLQQKVEALSPGATPADVLLTYALGRNPTGVTLASMFRPDHIRTNCARASAAPDPQFVADLRRLIVGTPVL